MRIQALAEYGGLTAVATEVGTGAVRRAEELLRLASDNYVWTMVAALAIFCLWRAMTRVSIR